jgi:hypothetical protein
MKTYSNAKGHSENREGTRLQNQRKSRRRQRTKKRKQGWMRIEYCLCILALLVAIGMTGTWMSHAIYVAGESGRDAAEEEANEPEYVTFFRGVVGESQQEEVADQSEAEDATDNVNPLVDISQFDGDDGYAGQVYALREEYPSQVEKILSNYADAQYYTEGSWVTVGEQDENAIPERLLQLVANNIETIDFVAAYPKKHQQVHENVSLSEELESSDFPLLLQWDERWGYESYGDGLIGYTGCGPTCLAMVALYLNQDPTVTPKTVADYADEAGYYTDGVGSAWSLMGTGCEAFGLKGTEMTISESLMIDQIAQGNPLICAMGPGDFTLAGHFIVVVGYEDGQFIVRDPNSNIRSERTWSYSELASQIKNIWYFTKL